MFSVGSVEVGMNGLLRLMTMAGFWYCGTPVSAFNRP